MWVRSDARGSTVASRLVDHVLAVAGTERELVLGIMADNARARAFYERVGFIMSVESIAEVHPQCLIRMVFPR